MHTESFLEAILNVANVRILTLCVTVSQVIALAVVLH